jgi:hypothetical protein
MRAGLLCGAAQASVVISSAPTSNVTCIGGTCTATAADAVLNAKDFRRLLGAGDLTLVSGSLAQDIVIAAKVQYTKTHHLTLDSFRGIAFQLELASEGGGGVTIKTNDGGSGGALTYGGKGKLTFWDTASGLVIDGTSYTLANDIATLASDIAANPSGAFALGRGYDASVDGAYGAAPIPTTFTGTFTGLGHTIANLTIHSAHQHSASVGLFAAIGTRGQASDVSLDAASVKSGIELNTAMFAGTNAGTIRNVSVSGSVEARGGNPAALVGENAGTVSGAHASGNVANATRRGVAAGLVGTNGGMISRSTSSVNVGAGKVACGLVGINGGTVTLSSATGSVNISLQQHNESSFAAGLVCTNGGIVSQSFSTATIYAGYGKQGESDSWWANGGGLVEANENGGTVQDCYFLGAVSAEPELALGGLASASYGTIATSYSAGTVPATPVQYTGGLIGELNTANGVDTNDYWDLDASGISDPSRGAGNVANAPGLTGLTTAQFQSGLPTGFDPAVWGQTPSVNNGYPYLLANPPQ